MEYLRWGAVALLALGLLVAMLANTAPSQPIVFDTPYGCFELRLGTAPGGCERGPESRESETAARGLRAGE